MRFFGFQDVICYCVFVIFLAHPVVYGANTPNYHDLRKETVLIAAKGNGGKISSRKRVKVSTNRIKKSQSILVRKKGKGRQYTKKNLQNNGRVGKQKVARNKSVRKAKDTNALSNRVLSVACKYVGTPYMRGGLTRLGIDCSGLVYKAYKEAGVTLPRTAHGMKKVGKTISMKNLKGGDLIFFSSAPRSKQVVHVGMVLRKSSEGITFIHASSSVGVTESSLKNSYHASRYLNARRIIGV